MIVPEPAARTWTIPLAVEDRIALDHLGQTLTGRESLSMTATVRQMQAALDAAYQAGWRQGMAERGAAVSTHSALPLKEFIDLRIAARGVPAERAKAYWQSVHGRAFEQKLLLRILSGRAPIDAIDDELTLELPLIWTCGVPS